MFSVIHDAIFLRDPTFNITHDVSGLHILSVCIPLMSSRIPSQLVPLLSVSQSVFHVGAPTTRPSKSGSFPSSVSPISAGSAASPPSSYTKSQDMRSDHAPFCILCAIQLQGCMVTSLMMLAISSVWPVLVLKKIPSCAKQMFRLCCKAKERPLDVQ